MTKDRITHSRALFEECFQARLFRRARLDIEVSNDYRTSFTNMIRNITSLKSSTVESATKDRRIQFHTVNYGYATRSL